MKISYRVYDNSPLTVKLTWADKRPIMERYTEIVDLVKHSSCVNRFQGHPVVGCGNEILMLLKHEIHLVTRFTFFY